MRHQLTTDLIPPSPDSYLCFQVAASPCALASARCTSPRPSCSSSSWSRACSSSPCRFLISPDSFVRARVSSSRAPFVSSICEIKIDLVILKIGGFIKRYTVATISRHRLQLSEAKLQFKVVQTCFTASLRIWIVCNGLQLNFPCSQPKFSMWHLHLHQNTQQHCISIN